MRAAQKIEFKEFGFDWTRRERGRLNLGRYLSCRVEQCDGQDSLIVSNRNTIKPGGKRAKALPTHSPLPQKQTEGSQEVELTLGATVMLVQK